MSNEYAKQFKDPRWQRKRLEILEMNNFSCENCESVSEELHVHHRFYIKGRAVWDYKDNDLVTLCENCHKEWHEAKDQLLLAVGMITDASLVQRLIGYASVLCGDTFYSQLDNYERTIGAADYFRVNVVDIEEIMDKSDGLSPLVISEEIRERSI